MALSTPLFQSLSIPPLSSRPCHLHLSTGQYPIIHTTMLQMSKPPQSATPHHIRHTLHTRRLYKSTLRFLSLQRHPAHPSHHHPAPSSPDFADSLSSLSRFQSHMSIHSGHEPCISFPLCGMIHPFKSHVGYPR